MALVQIETRPRGRRWAVLVPFLQKAEFDAMLIGGNNFALTGSQAPEDAWQRCIAASRAIPPYAEGTVKPIPSELEAAARGLEGREVFQREYARKADVRLGMVPLDSLLSPQPAADLDYVDELMGRLVPVADPAADFPFAFPEASPSDPLVAGPTVIFNEETSNLIINPIPEWHRAGDDVLVSLRASARPNYLWVAEMAGRLVLLNGVHKVLAAIRAGRSMLPAVLRTANSIPELGLQQPPTFLAHLLAPRPPLVSDFLQPIAVMMDRRPTRTLTRLIIQVDQIPVPE